MKHAVTILVTAGLLTLAGCGFAQPRPPGAVSSSGPSATSDPSAAADRAAKGTVAKGKPVGDQAGDSAASDVMFLQMMVSQEQQTADLIELAKGRSLSAPTRNLTTAIGATQADEAKRMTARLRRQKQPTKASSDAATHTAHGATTALTDDDLEQLRNAKGKEFERGLLNLLLGQQHNAIELARASKTSNDPWVEDLAEQVDRSRTAQVTQMLQLVAAIPVA